jgi:hypothetical protein
VYVRDIIATVISYYVNSIQSELQVSIIKDVINDKGHAEIFFILPKGIAANLTSVH